MTTNCFNKWFESIRSNSKKGTIKVKHQNIDSLICTYCSDELGSEFVERDSYVYHKDCESIYFNELDASPNVSRIIPESPQEPTQQIHHVVGSTTPFYFNLIPGSGIVDGFKRKRSESETLFDKVMKYVGPGILDTYQIMFATVPVDFFYDRGYEGLMYTVPFSLCGILAIGLAKDLYKKEL